VPGQRLAWRLMLGVRLIGKLQLCRWVCHWATGPVTTLLLSSQLLLHVGCASRHSNRPALHGPPGVTSSSMRQNSPQGQVGSPSIAPFVSFNLPNLHYIEDDWRFSSIVRYRLPNEFEIHDGLSTVRLLGGTVIRIYALSVRKASDSPDIVRHVNGPGQFNEAAFQALDVVLSKASELGIKIIIPFVDNWAHWGGVAEYAGFRGKPREAFFSDHEIIGDFEKTLEKVILRTNTVNGKLYRDDPTIYAWETGNELGSPDRWVSQIAQFIKKLDPKHALIDGTYGPLVREHALSDPNIDIVSSHHYGPVARTLRMIDENVRMIRGKKRYFIGEFGLLSAADTERVIRRALSHNIEGILLWSLRFHNRDGGFYYHMEKPPYQSYHFPGFASGHDYEEQPIMQMMRRFAFEVRGQEVPPLPVPATPALLPVTNVADIRWRGSAGASYYVVERETSGTGNWQIIGSRVDETQTPYRAGFVDNSASVGSKVRYRVLAANETGISPPSLPSEELTVLNQVLVDEMVSKKLLSSATGTLDITTDHSELCKMDRNRLVGKPESRIVYQIKGRPRTLQIFAFAQQAGNVFDLAWSSNGHAFSKLASVEQPFAGAVDEPVAFRPVLVSSTSIPSNAREIAISWLMPAEISRVEIEWVP
jgi:mannan endo-1,4-beta-mannosidase